MVNVLFPSLAQEEEASSQEPEVSKEERIKAYRDDEIKLSDNIFNYFGLSFYNQAGDEFEAGERYEELRIRVRRSEEAIEALGAINSMKVTTSYMTGIGFLVFASTLGVAAILGVGFDSVTRDVSFALSGSFTVIWLLATLATNPGVVPEIYNNHLLERENLSPEDVL